MIKKRFSKLIIAFASLIFILVPISVSAVSAPDGGGNGLKISPIKTSLTINPGETKTVPIYITNVTDGSALMQMIVNDFQANPNETGQPDIILNPDQQAATHSLKQFVAPQPNFNLGPHEEKKIDVQISVPKGAAGGGYYGAVRFVAVGNGNKSVNISTSIVSLILVTVPGDITQNLQLASFGVASGDTLNGFFTNGSGLNVITRFTNLGNVQEVPFGKILLKHGNNIIATYEMNGGDQPGDVLPNSIRRFEQPLSKLGWGKYTVEGNFGYGNQGKLLSAQKTFYIIPVWLIIGVLVLIILIILAIILGRKELKRHDKRLLANNRRRTKN